jgi:hypothetical protein
MDAPMIRHYKVFLHGRTTDLMASSRTHALNTALELFMNERIYRVSEINDWDDDNDKE